MKDKIKAQLEQLNDRERFMVYAAALALLIFLPYQLLWAPLMNTVEDRRAKIEKQERYFNTSSLAYVICSQYRK